jgi:hypothetical protein
MAGRFFIDIGKLINYNKNSENIKYKIVIEFGVTVAK